jgi:hypothetical protein
MIQLSNCLKEPHHGCEEGGVFGCFGVPLVLVQVVLKFQHQAVVVATHHLQDLLLRGRGQPLTGQPGLYFGVEVTICVNNNKSLLFILLT